MDSRTKLDKALVTITTESSLIFWAGLSVQVPKVITEDIPTAATDGEKVYFNPNYIVSLPNNQIIFLILHELLHIIRGDVIRVGNRDKEDWNIAADAVENDMLKQLGGKVEPIKEGIYPEGELAPLKGQSSEWNYEWIRKNKNKLSIKSSHDILLKNPKIQRNPSEHKNKIKRMVQAAVQIAKKKEGKDGLGSLPSELKDWIIKLTSPKVDWRTVLHEFIGTAVKQDWSWNRPHTSILLSTGCIAPTIIKNPKIANIAVLLDSSGSVNDKDLAQFWDEITGMSGIIEKLTIAHFTVGIDAIYTYDFNVDTIESIIPTERYQGGTSIPIALEDLMQKVETNEIDSPEVIIILSDMESLMPEEELSIPIFWAVLGNKEFKAPFGTQINIEQEGTLCQIV